jgi:hypothetical protein
MTITTGLTDEQARAGERIDALDLEPIVVKLMHPEPGQAAITLAEADQLIAAYRSFLKLCAWYPDEDIVPSKGMDLAWHTHILDTGKYAADTEAVFGYFLNHFPYFGMRGDDDVTAWQAAGDRTRELFRAHFGTDMPGGPGESCHVGGSDCRADNGAICSFCSDRQCDKVAHATLSAPRPRPDRAPAPA